MRAGLLNQPLIIQRKGYITNADGGAIADWTEFARRWGRVQPLGSAEKSQSNGSDWFGKVKITIRDFVDLEETDRIVVMEYAFGIDNILHVDEARRETICNCTQVIMPVIAHDFEAVSLLGETMLTGMRK